MAVLTHLEQALLLLSNPDTGSGLGIKFMAHKHIFTALGTFVLKHFGHSPITKKVTGDIAH